jgi:hypothetical protein
VLVQHHLLVFLLLSWLVSVGVLLFFVVFYRGNYTKYGQILMLEVTGNVEDWQ